MRRILGAAAGALALLGLLAGEGTAEAAKGKTPRKKASPRKAAAKPGIGPSPAAIVGASALASWFERLAALPSPPAEGGPVARVLHWGDSHVAADYWSGELRRLLQERYGDGGPGTLVPGRPWRYFRHALVKSPRAEGWQTLGFPAWPPTGVLGLAGVALVPLASPEPLEAPGSFRDFVVQAAVSGGEPCLGVSVDGDSLYQDLLPPGPGSAACARVEAIPWSVDGSSLVFLAPARPLDGPWHRLAVTACGGYVEVLGVDLKSGTSGVVLDTFGLNGAELGWLSRWEPAVRRILLERADPALIVVSYGTNDMGRGDLDADTYRSDAARVLAELRTDAPRAALLVTGPIDRGHRKKREAARLKANADLVIGALRRAAADTGAAFWDARAAMGGPGSIGRWAAKGWAQRDRVHLTGPGYVELARLLLAALDGARRGSSEPLP